MSLNMNDILQEIGWTNGFHVPVANAENQALEAELERLTVQKAKAKSSFENVNQRFEALTKHLKYVLQEAEQNQKLITAYRQQTDAENNKLKASQSENERVNQEIRHMTKSTEEISDRNDIKRNDLTKCMAKLEKLKAESAWDEEALKAWEESLKKRDDDNEMLKKFSKEDDHKGRDLEAKRQRLQMEVTGKKETVARMVAEITNYEQMLERTGKLFKQQDEERTALVEKWQDAVKHLRQRDEDINKANKDIYLTQLAIDKQQEILEEHNNFLNNEMNNNKNIEEEINEFNSVNSRMRRDLNDMLQHIFKLTNEFSTSKRTMASTANRLEKERLKSKNLDKEMQNLKYKITNTNLALEGIRKKMEDVNLSLMTTSERTKRLEHLINEEQRETGTITQDLERIQTVLFRNEVTLQNLKSAATNAETEIYGCEISVKMLEKHCKLKLGELQVQKELIYGLDYRIHEMEVEISHWEGQNKVDEETEAMNAKITELEQILAEHNEGKNFLQGQITRLEDEMRRLGIAIAADTELIETLRGKLQDQILLFEGGVKQAAAAKLKSQQRQVEENVLRLKVSQLEKAISKENDNIYDLEKFRLELETSVRERQIEINTHKDILAAQRKNLDESKGRLRADINLRKIRVDQFQKKHHIALTSLGKDDDGQPLSITHFKIKNAQEKYMLQQEGDDLDNKIKKAEKEIVAMENTLKIINVTNATYKKSLSSVDEDSEERMELKQLEQEVINRGIVLKEHKKLLADKRATLKKLRDEFDEVNEKMNEESEKLEEIKKEYSNLKKEEEPRHEKLMRTCKQLKELKKRISATALEKPEKNLEIRQMQDATRSALQQLTEISVRYPEVAPLVNRYVKEHQLELPGSKSKLSSSSSSATSISVRSNQSSRNSIASCSTMSQVILTFDENARKKSSAARAATSKHVTM